MDYRFPAFALVALLLAFAVVAASLGAKSAYAQADDTWYVGEGAKQDMYVKYRIQEYDTNNGQPYEMTIYFQEQQDGDWIAPTFVVDQGRVIKGTLKLGNNLAPLSGGADVPQEMSDYIGGYRGSLQWLEAFTPQESPKSLTQTSWGKIACIGCEDMKPQGPATVTVPAGTYETTQVGWHRGQTDSKLWILNGFPYPVKAETYVDVTTGTPPIQFKFELLETGTGQPVAPEDVVEVPQPPLSRDTGRGGYEVHLDWDPASIEPGQEVTFGLSFFDSTGFPVDNVNYDFMITDTNGETVVDLKSQLASDGTDQQPVTFESAGPAKVTITLNAVQGQPASPGGTFVESAEFSIAVVPEFPISAAIMAGAVVGLVVLLMRVKGASFGSMFGGSKGAI
jgi:hypothetical protein